MRHVRDLSIVLKSISFEDRHRIVTALTENHGRITALAKNSIHSRRFGGALEPFCASEWNLKIKDRPGGETAMVFLESVNLKRGFDGLRRDFIRLSAASVLGEVINKIAPEQQPCRELFLLLSNALAILEEMAEVSPFVVLNGCFVKILQWYGSPPQSRGCLRCAVPLEKMGEAQLLACGFESAGWFCGDCRSPTTQALPRQAWVDLLQAQAFPLKHYMAHLQANADEHRKIFEYLEGVVAYHVPGFDRKAIKAIRFLGIESSLQR